MMKELDKSNNTSCSLVSNVVVVLQTRVKEKEEKSRIKEKLGERIRSASFCREEVREVASDFLVRHS